MRNDLDANIKQISNNEASDYELDLKQNLLDKLVFNNSEIMRPNSIKFGNNIR